MDQASKSINGFILNFASSFDQLKVNSTRKLTKKTEKVILENVNNHREGIYTSFKLEISAFTNVVQCREALTFSYY